MKKSKKNKIIAKIKAEAGPSGIIYSSHSRKSEIRSNFQGFEGVFIVYIFDLALGLIKGKLLKGEDKTT